MKTVFCICRAPDTSSLLSKNYPFFRGSEYGVFNLKVPWHYTQLDLPYLISDHHRDSGL